MVNLSNDETVIYAATASTVQFSKMQDPEQYINENDLNWTTTPRDKITPFMDALINNPASDRLREVQQSEKTLFHDDVYGEIFFTNAYGANVAQTDKTTDYRQDDESWWQQADKNGVYVGKIEVDNSSGFSSFAISKSIQDKNGNFVGVIKAVTNIQQVINIIKTQMESGQYTPTGYELISPDGLVLYSTDANEKPFSYTHDSDFMSNIKDNSGTFSYTYPDSDEQQIIAYAKSSSSKIEPLFDWIFVTEYKSVDVLKPISQLSDIMITIMIVTISSVSVIVFFIVHRLSSPIEKIRRGLREYIGGNNVEITVNGIEEMEVLASDVNYLMKKLTENNQTIITSKEKYRTLFQSTPTSVYSC